MNHMRNKFRQLQSEFGYIEKRYKGGGGSKSSAKFIQSPEGKQAWSAISPAFGNIKQAFRTGGELYDVGAPGEVTQAPMPTAGWYSGIAPEVMAGIREPYQQASEDLMSQLGQAGVGGSAAGGLSGTAADSLGRFWSDAGTQMGQQAWSMMQPGMQSQWQAEQQRNNAIWQAGLQARQAPYSMLTSLAAGAAPQAVIEQKQSGGGSK